MRTGYLRHIALTVLLWVSPVIAFAALDPITNFAESTLASGIAAGATSLNVASSTGAKFPSSFPYPLVLWNCVDYSRASQDPGVEIVLVTNRSGDTMTVTRGQEGTADVAHNTGGKTYCLELNLTKGMWDRIQTTINAAASSSTLFTYDCSGYASCNAAVAQIATDAPARATLRVTNDQVIASNLTIPLNVRVERAGGGIFSIIDGVTLRFESPEQIQADTRAQLFAFSGSGTGIVAFSNPGTVPITWCGAIAGDGNDDSTAAIKCAQGLPSSTVGSILEIPPGLYAWNRELDLSLQNLMVKMVGSTLDITGMTGTGHSNIHGSGDVLSAIRLTGNRQRVVGGRITGPIVVQTTIRTAGVLIDGATNARVSSVLADGLYACVWAGGNAVDLTLANIDANACGYGVYLGFAGGTMSNPQLTRATLTNVRAHHSTIGDGLIFDSHSRDVAVLGGFFYSNATNGIYGEFSGERVQIIGANMFSNSGRGLRMKYGTNTGDTAGKWGYARRALIADNILKDNTLDNLSVQLDDYSTFSTIGGVEEVTIANNYSEGSGDDGYVINCVRCIIQGNQAHRNQGDGFTFRSLQDATIQGNQSWDNGLTGDNRTSYKFITAATTGSAPPNSQRISFIGNLGGDTRSGAARFTNFTFNLNKLDNSLVSGNIGTNANTADWVNTTGLTSVAFMQNRGTVSGSDTIGTPIAKHLVGSKTYDPASTLNDASWSTTITVTGAAVGDQAQCSFSNSLAGWNLRAHVTSADTVTCTGDNWTGATVDLASGTLYGVAWKH